MDQGTAHTSLASKPGGDAAGSSCSGVVQWLRLYF